uniref:Uncharacterized protein n=1 Tax=Sinocyclocheilus rhinocerous TaxID=307959 RepID=A0A673NHP7_9TELE
MRSETQAQCTRSVTTLVHFHKTRPVSCTAGTDSPKPQELLQFERRIPRQLMRLCRHATVTLRYGASLVQLFCNSTKLKITIVSMTKPSKDSVLEKVFQGFSLGESSVKVKICSSMMQCYRHMSLSPLDKRKNKREQIEFEKTTYDMLSSRSCG